MPRIKTGIKIALITIFVILIVYYLQKYGIEPLKEAVQSMGIWAPVGIAFLRGISIVLPALPSSVYSLLAGSLLGFETGYLTIIFADFVLAKVARLRPRQLIPPQTWKSLPMTMAWQDFACLLEMW